MPAPLLVSDAVHLSAADKKEDKKKLHITPAMENAGNMLGMFDDVSIKNGYQPMNAFDVKNEQALMITIKELSDQTSFYSPRRKGFFNRLLHPSKPSNPFTLVDEGYKYYQMVEQNWGRVVNDLAYIIMRSLADDELPDLQNNLVSSIRNLVKTAASYPSDNTGENLTYFTKHISKEVPGGWPLFVIYQLGVDLGMAFNNQFPAAQMKYYYAIFSFNPDAYNDLHPDLKVKPRSIESVINRLTSREGPNPKPICF